MSRRSGNAKPDKTELGVQRAAIEEERGIPPLSSCLNSGMSKRKAIHALLFSLLPGCLQSYFSGVISMKLSTDSFSTLAFPSRS